MYSTYIVLKASSCVTFGLFFATRASIVCIDSGKHKIPRGLIDTFHLWTHTIRPGDN